MVVDPVKQAEELARVFFALSNAVDLFRLDNYNTLSANEQQRLKIQAQALDGFAQQYTADALAAILERTQPHLGSIRDVTTSARGALAHLNDVGKAMAIVDSAVVLAGSIARGDLGSIGDNVKDLYQKISS